LTHLATGAAISPAPLWLVEGFADYVALRGSPPSDRGVVADLAWQVRRAGVPEGLPGRERFGAGGRSLAAAYQGSWLACRLIASRAGEQALVRVYDRVSAGESLPRVLRDETGQGMPGLVRAWRVRLTHWRA
jgi:hypothetical protein